MYLVLKTHMNYSYLYNKLQLVEPKFNKKSLENLEAIYQDLGYAIRYEKGTFQSGFCVLEDQKIVLINKFFDVHGRVYSLLDILNQLKVEVTELSEENRKRWIAFKPWLAAHPI